MPEVLAWALLYLGLFLHFMERSAFDQQCSNHVILEVIFQFCTFCIRTFLFRELLLDPPLRTQLRDLHLQLFLYIDYSSVCPYVSQFVYVLCNITLYHTL